MQFLELKGNNLDINKIASVSYDNTIVEVTHEEVIRARINKSYQIIQQAVAEEKTIYGVNTNFGGMAKNHISINEIFKLQANLIWGLKAGTGNYLPESHVRAAMLLRANSLIKGASGVRLELIERFCQFLNAGITPKICEYGSIGASGDLVPLSYIAGNLIGLSDCYMADYQGQTINALKALQILELPKLSLDAKEGLALVNGTSVSTGIAALCTYNMEFLFDLTLSLHGFFVQILKGSLESFDEFIHQQKPHQGQINVAQKMRYLLEGSGISRDKTNYLHPEQLVQDRYSLRCMPQYLGPILDEIQKIRCQVEVEANCANDNPLIDCASEKILSSGNFLSEYIAIGMDQLRFFIALLAKHIDAQIALIMTPEFNYGLPASLAANGTDSIKFGLKGIQLCMNSIVPILLHQANPITQLYLTHSEQFNQNISSQSYNSANLTWHAICTLRQYLAMGILVAIQGIELRVYQETHQYDARKLLSPKLIPFYETVYTIIDKKISAERPLIHKNDEQALDEYTVRITRDLANNKSNIFKLFK